MKHLYFLIYGLLMQVSSTVYAQPGPGDYFREYIWTTPGKEKNSTFFRVGGRFDYRLQPENYPDLLLMGERIPLNHEISLTNAIKSEVTVEKVLCHDGTRNLKISINGHKPYVFPESQYIPEPQELYMHHFYPTIQIPLSELDQGHNNYFSLEVDTVHSWKWPQNLIYGVIFRNYYPVPENIGKTSIAARSLDDNTVELILEYDNPDEIRSVDFLAKYEGADLDGDGDYKDWHYHYYRGVIRNHAGSASISPFKHYWDVSWIPDQNSAIQLSARINYKNGTCYFIPESNFILKRNTYSVELCKPEKQPQRWLTRRGEHQVEFNVSGDISKIKEAKMVFTSWSPGYLNGIYINDFLVFIKEGPKYEFMQHDIPVKDLLALKSGINILKTGKTPLYQGKMVHGTEIMWPGIMILTRSLK